jgi:UDP-N-acetylmuramyl pentapeptide phosphotransferase/UDP-N-acetylglucosamine-1-phosphate transferase
MQWSLPLIFFGCVFLATLVLTGVLVRFFRTHNILDYPNQRSSHSIPTPKGAGIAVIGCVSVSWIIVTWSTPMAGDTLVVVFAALFLATVSWFDDIKGLSTLWRFFAQISAVTFVLLIAWSWPKSEFILFGEKWSVIWAYFAIGIVWVWFINLFNFMDGVDGISGIETATIGIGVALICLVAGLESILGLFGIILSASALGFLVWNWHPAKIFLGDVGSIPLGFLLGWLLLQLAVSGQWATALILPLYYIGDATITLVRRGLLGKKVWHAHNEHFYQQAILRGFSHSKVVCYIFFINVAMIILAITAALGWVWLSLISAGMIVMWLLFFFSARSGPGKF